MLGSLEVAECCGVGDGFSALDTVEDVLLGELLWTEPGPNKAISKEWGDREEEPARQLGRGKSATQQAPGKLANIRESAKEAVGRDSVVECFLSSMHKVLDP